MAKRFRSYLNNFEVEMKEKGKGTFKSYIDFSEEEEEEKDEEIEKNAAEFFDGKDLKPATLFPGEAIHATARSVLKFRPFSNYKGGTTGHLVVTNFRICFVTADCSSYETDDGDKIPNLHKNKLLDEHDIPLSHIDAVYQVSDGRRKKLTLGGTVSSASKNLEVHCKDFRIHTFGFKFTPTSESKMVTNAIIYHASPRKKSDLLFAYGGAFLANRVDVPMFDRKEDWDRELERLDCQARWITTDANKDFHLSFDLPAWFVIPARLTNNDLLKAAPQFNANRVPTWSYTHGNGSCLVRMSEVVATTDLRHLEDKMVEAVKEAGDVVEPMRVDLTKACPSLVDIQSSYTKLKEICMTDSEKQFGHQDMTFFKDLEGTQWLHFVSRCLSISRIIVGDMAREKTTVIIREETSHDLCPLVSCLVQLCLDEHCRTQAGFEKLLQREWVALGHPFQRRLGLSIESDNDQSPVFLLFLDCVWQLLQQFPATFAFTETYLTRLWDSAISGLFKTFVFNNQHQYPLGCKLLAAWDWHQQFSQEDILLFNNPLFLQNPKFNLANSIKEVRSSLRRAQRQQRQQKSYAVKLTQFYNEEPVPLFEDAGPKVLQPSSMLPRLRLWSQCYLRWCMPAQIVGGGSPCEYLQHCLMVEQIMSLQHRLSSLQGQLQNQGSLGRLPRPKSDLIFSFDGVTSQNQLTESQVTSSYPFSPGPESNTPRPSLFTYFECSEINFDYTDAED